MFQCSVINVKRRLFHCGSPTYLPARTNFVKCFDPHPCTGNVKYECSFYVVLLENDTLMRKIFSYIFINNLLLDLLTSLTCFSISLVFETDCEQNIDNMR